MDFRRRNQIQSHDNCEKEPPFNSKQKGNHTRLGFGEMKSGGCQKKNFKNSLNKGIGINVWRWGGIWEVAKGGGGSLLAFVSSIYIYIYS